MLQNKSLAHARTAVAVAALLAGPVFPAYASGIVAPSKSAENTEVRTFVKDSAAPLIVELFKAPGMSNDINVRLKEEVNRAIALGRTPVLEISASRCGICRLLDASMQHARVREVLRDMYIIRVDVDVWRTQLSAAGYRGEPDIPVIVALGANGRPTGQMWSGSGMPVDGNPATMRPEDDPKYVGQVATALRQFFSTCQREFFKTMM